VPPHPFGTDARQSFVAHVASGVHWQLWSVSRHVPAVTLDVRQSASAAHATQTWASQTLFVPVHCVLPLHATQPFWKQAASPTPQWLTSEAVHAAQLCVLVSQTGLSAAQPWTSAAVHATQVWVAVSQALFAPVQSAAVLQPQVDSTQAAPRAFAAQSTG
jgi:hypothetical protein